MLTTKRYFELSRFSQTSHAFYCSDKHTKKVKYTDTVLLPKTRFPQYLNSKQTIDRDRQILEKCGLLDYYAWQQKNVRGKEFVLHDGPPYANGKPHIGHAINKITKDITLRSQTVQGKRVHFIPGWDCHGLPIELKALNSLDTGMSPQEIRKKAQDFAHATTQTQMSSFKNWGVMGDWENQCYYTYDKSYVTNQLQTFWKIYQKGLLFRDLKPVYWSPSSRTALAEAELVYKDDHVSKAVTLRLRVVGSDPIYLLVWTTTPWTLPANEAVCFSNNIEYSLVRVPSAGDARYVMATKLVPELQAKLKEEVTVEREFLVEELARLKYEHPVRKGEVRGLLDAPHVTLAGTGLVHTAPAHGHDDFLVALKHGLSKKCFVDEEGRFTSGRLAGLAVLAEGASRVLEEVSDSIVLREPFRHSYPYDWRTDKPVIIRASQQWFIDTASLKHAALESLKQMNISEERLETLLQARPYWCVSRQRTWGVPIPVFYHTASGRPLLTQNLVDHVCRTFEASGVDAWWTHPPSTLFPPRVCRETFVHAADVTRGADIMDIWFDSGVSWNVLDGRVADVCVEGVDQFTGWFQSALLTSVAVRDKAPYRRLLTHGFAVDEDGRKMSKSQGNVLDPETVTEGKSALGVDTLRWWVASHSHHTHIPVSPRILQTTSESVHKLRITLRFILGALHKLSDRDLTAPCRLNALDRYILNACFEFYRSVMAAYNAHAYNQVSVLVTNFVANTVSGLYVHVIKDRLYCDAAESERRRASRIVLHGLLDVLCHAIAPLVPHLAEEAFDHHPLGPRRLFYSAPVWAPPASWESDEARATVELALRVKKEVDALCGVKCQQHVCTVQVNEKDHAALKVLQEEEESYDSELTELLQVSGARIELSPGEQAVTVSVKETARTKCPRCRRHCSTTSEALCSRCHDVLKGLPNKNNSLC